MANIAGYKAVLEASNHFGRSKGMFFWFDFIRFFTVLRKVFHWSSNGRGKGGKFL
jgi:hypothetical protein